MINKVLDEAVVTALVGLCRIVSGDMLFRFEKVALVAMSYQRNNHILQNPMTEKLSEHQGHQLVSAREVLDILVTTSVSKKML